MSTAAEHAPSDYVVMSEARHPLEGDASAGLVEASLSSRLRGSGVVPAFLEHGVWQYVPPAEVDAHRHKLGYEIVPVYVERPGSD